MNERRNKQECVNYLESAFILCDHRVDLGYYKIILDFLNGLYFQTKNGFETSKLRIEYKKLWNYLMDKYKNIKYFNFNPDDEFEKKFMLENSIGIINRLDYFGSIFIKAIPGGLGLIILAGFMSRLKKQFYPALGNAFYYTIEMCKHYANADKSYYSLIEELEKKGKSYIKWRDK